MTRIGSGPSPGAQQQATGSATDERGVVGDEAMTPTNQDVDAPTQTRSENGPPSWAQGPGKPEGKGPNGGKHGHDHWDGKGDWDNKQGWDNKSGGDTRGSQNNARTGNSGNPQLPGNSNAAGNPLGEFSHPLSNTIGQLGRLVSDIFSPSRPATQPTPGQPQHYESGSGSSQTVIRNNNAPPPATQNPGASGTHPPPNGRVGTPPPGEGGARNPNAGPGNNANPHTGATGNASANPTGSVVQMTPRAEAGMAARGAETAAGTTAQTNNQTPAQQQAGLLQGMTASPTMQAVLQTLATQTVPLASLAGAMEEPATLPQQGNAQNPRDALARDLLRGNVTQLPMAPGQTAPGQAEEHTLPNTLADPRKQAQAEQAQTRPAADAEAQARADQRGDARNIANPRAAESLVRTDVNDPRNARDADKTRNAALSEALRAQQAEGTKRTGLLAAMAQSGSLRGSASVLARHALDWVGQLAKELGIGSTDGEEGAHAMRVVAGLVIAAIGVLLVIGVIYALRVILHGG